MRAPSPGRSWNPPGKLLALAGFICATFSAAVASEEVGKAPAPPWVEAVAIPEATAQREAQSGNGVIYLLADQQREESSQTSYQHFARKFISSNGVQENSRIEIDFEPSYETLTLHQLRIHRNGETLDRLPTAKIRILKREEELSQHLYNGHVTAIVDVEDIRVGDTLEYSFSLQGGNPVFGGVFSDFIMASWPAPLAAFQLRVLWPKDRYLGTKSFGKAPTPTRTETENAIEYRWTATDIAPVVAEDETPTWFSPFAWIQLSGYRNWQEVEEWGRAFYSLEAPLPPDVQTTLAGLRQLSTGEEQAIGALEYVQDQIRYLSISEGVHAYRPYPIDSVIQRGFGDCKDKARLLCAMLTALGFKAHPALVNSRYLGEIGEWLPTPLDFDHVIVRLELNGQTYWLDPTRDHQRGPLAERYSPPYGKALIIGAGQTGLTHVEPMGFSQARIDIETRFDVPAYDQPAQIDIRADYHGREADWMRYLLANSNRSQLQKNYLNDITRFYPGVGNRKDLEFSDSRRPNHVRSDEAYVVPKLWQKNEETPDSLFTEVYPTAIDAETKLPQTRLRTSPIAVNHPKKLRETFVLQLPEPGNFPAEAFTVKDPAFQFAYSSRQSDRTLTVSYEYQSLADQVGPERAPEYLANLKKVRDKLGYSISVPRHRVEGGAAETGTPALSGGFNWMLLCLLLMFSAFIAAGVFFAYRWRPNWPPKPAHPRYAGLGGWLILIAFGLFTRPILTFAGMADFLHLFRMEIWNQFTLPGYEYYHPLWAPLFLGELLVILTLTAFSVLLIVLFFQRRRTFPVFFIAVIGVSAIFTMFDSILLAPLARQFPSLDLDTGPKEVVQTLIQAFIWIPYALVSERVKATFVR